VALTRGGSAVGKWAIIIAVGSLAALNTVSVALANFAWD
jgi:hypothetical protein